MSNVLLSKADSRLYIQYAFHLILLLRRCHITSYPQYKVQFETKLCRWRQKDKHTANSTRQMITINLCCTNSLKLADDGVRCHEFRTNADSTVNQISGVFIEYSSRFFSLLERLSIANRRHESSRWDYTVLLIPSPARDSGRRINCRSVSRTVAPRICCRAFHAFSWILHAVIHFRSSGPTP